MEGIIICMGLILLLSLAAGGDMSMLITGNFSGTGYNHSYIHAPGCNVSGNNSSWLIEWEDNLNDRNSL
jgi:hypothetical protein